MARIKGDVKVGSTQGCKGLKARFHRVLLRTICEQRRNQRVTFPIHFPNERDNVVMRIARKTKKTTTVVYWATANAIETVDRDLYRPRDLAVHGLAKICARLIDRSIGRSRERHDRDSRFSFEQLKTWITRSKEEEKEEEGEEGGGEEGEETREEREGEGDQRSKANLPQRLRRKDQRLNLFLFTRRQDWKVGRIPMATLNTYL